MVNLIWILGFGKNSGLNCLEIESKLEKNIKEGSLKHQATGFASLR